MRSAVLFLVFNRPASTRRVFEAIRHARPPRLYVAADGARSERSGEAAICEETRRVATAVDWPCEVRTLMRDRNLGCKQAVSSGISWFFEQEEEGIILEDDCLPDPSFFRFCEELLERYRHDPRIAVISGDNFQFGRTHGEASYYFSRYVHIWGWASWRRVWRTYDRDMREWPAFRDTLGLRKVLRSNREIRYWQRIFDAVHAGEIDTWDYQLLFCAWRQAMISVIPQKNLISNIGFGPDATRTVGASRYADLPAESMQFPLLHPVALEPSARADENTAQEMFLKPFSERVMHRLQALGKKWLAGK